jgi:hypothetical protein
MNARVVEIARQMRDSLDYIPFENFFNGLGDGRIEQLQKDSRLSGITPDEMILIHEIEEMRFRTIAEAAIDDALKDEIDFEELKKIVHRVIVKK